MLSASVRTALKTSMLVNLCVCFANAVFISNYSALLFCDNIFKFVLKCVWFGCRGEKGKGGRWKR